MTEPMTQQMTEQMPEQMAEQMTEQMVASVAAGDEAIAELGELAPYVDRRSSAFCTSSAWLLAAAHHLPATPVTVTVRSGGAPVALAALGVVHRRGARRVELLGGDLNDYGPLFHDTDEAAVALADAVVGWLRGQRRWSLALEQLAVDDPVLPALADRLSGAVVVPGPEMPQIVGVGSEYRVSRNRRKKIGNATNRIAADGHAWEQLVVDDPDELERWLPAVTEVRRHRDHASGRRSHLDDPAVLAFHEAVVRDAVRHGRAVVHLLTIDGRVGGYAVTMHDGPVHRLFDGRVAEEFQRYRGGMVCDLVAVARAAECPEVATFDWLRGTTEAKFGNHVHRRVALRAASHPLVTVVEAWEGVARRRIKAALPAAAVRRLSAR